MNFLFLLLLAQTVVCSYPVKDFRVADLSAGSNKAVNFVPVSKSQTVLVKTTSSVPSSAPTFVLSDEIQLLYTDESQSIYYLQSNISDASTSYSQGFPLLLDTGSPLTWVYNSTCTSNGCASSQVVKFNDSKPLKLASEFNLQYTGDPIDGETFSLQENGLEFKLGGINDLSNFSLGLTSDSPKMFAGFNISGILGIPSSSSSQTSDTNIISQLHSQGLIDKEVFGLYIVSTSQSVKYVNSNNRTSSIPANYGGLIVFGSQSQDGSAFGADDIHYIDILENQSQYWLLNITEIEVSNSSVQGQTFNTTQDYRNAIVDTGTTGIVLPTQDADNIHQLLFGSSSVTDNQGNFAFPCNVTSSVVTFTIGGKDFNLSSSDIKGQPYTSSSLQGYCASKIQGVDQYDYWILGVTFLNKLYTVFDLSDRKIGFGDVDLSSYQLQQGSTTNSSSPAPSSSSTRSAAASSSSLAYNNSTTNSSSSSDTRKNGSSKLSLGQYMLGLLILGILL